MLSPLEKLRFHNGLTDAEATALLFHGWTRGSVNMLFTHDPTNSLLSVAVTTDRANPARIWFGRDWLGDYPTLLEALHAWALRKEGLCKPSL